MNFTQNNWLIDKTKDYKKKEILKKIQLKFMVNLIDMKNTIKI